MKLVIRALIYVLAVAASPSFASSAGFGSLNTVLPHTGGALIFNQTGTRSARPACATQDRWAIGSATDAEKMLIATFLTAFAQGKQISIQGSGACTVWPDTETITYFIVN